MPGTTKRAAGSKSRPNTAKPRTAKQPKTAEQSAAQKTLQQKQASRATAYQAGFERLHRSYGAFLIQNLCAFTQQNFADKPDKQLPARVMITACHILQSFYCFASFLSEDVRLAAVAAISLSCKVEEVRTPIKVLVNHFLAMNLNASTASSALTKTGPASSSSQTASSVSAMGMPSPAPTVGAMLAVIHVPQVADMENRMLRLLGFELYEYCSFCPGAHVHNLLFEAFDGLVNVNDARGEKGKSADEEMFVQQREQVLQKAVAFANDSLRTSLCCRYSSGVILRACVELAGRKCQVGVGMFGCLRDDGGKAIDSDLVEKVMRELLAAYEGGEYFNVIQPAQTDKADDASGGDSVGAKGSKTDKKSSDDEADQRKVDLVFPARADSPSSDDEDSL